jgi:hypothetical protein
MRKYALWYVFVIRNSAYIAQGNLVQAMGGMSRDQVGPIPLGGLQPRRVSCFYSSLLFSSLPE